MPMFLDTRGEPTLGIAICARCSRKMPRARLSPDPNAPGLYVCDEDKDEFDPYRLAPRATEQLTMEWCRPDLTLTTVWATLSPLAPMGLVPVYLTDDDGNFITDDFGNRFVVGFEQGSTSSIVPLPSQIQPTYPWQASTLYYVGASVTPLNQNNPDVPLPQLQFVAVYAGRSGVTAPTWPVNPGVVFMDGAVTWLCYGIYLDEGIGTAFPAPRPGNTPVSFAPIVPIVPTPPPPGPHTPTDLVASAITSGGITLSWTP